MILTCSARHCFIRRCKVRRVAVPGYASGAAWESRVSKSFALNDRSACNHCTTCGQTCSKGSTRERHQCGLAADFRCVGLVSPSFHASERLCKNRGRSEVCVGSGSTTRGSVDKPARRFWQVRIVSSNRTGSVDWNCACKTALACMLRVGIARSRSHGVMGA